MDDGVVGLTSALASENFKPLACTTRGASDSFRLLPDCTKNLLDCAKENADSAKLSALFITCDAPGELPVNWPSFSHLICVGDYRASYGRFRALPGDEKDLCAIDRSLAPLLLDQRHQELSVITIFRVSQPDLRPPSSALVRGMLLFAVSVRAARQEREAYITVLLGLRWCYKGDSPPISLYEFTCNDPLEGLS